MTPLVAGGAALAVLAVVLIVGAWRLVVLDRDLTRLDEELVRLQGELRSTHQQLRVRDERQRETAILARQIKHYLDWAAPWIRYLVAVSQERRQ